MRANSASPRSQATSRSPALLGLTLKAKPPKYLKVFSWKTIALYVLLIELKEHLEVCLPFSSVDFYLEIQSCREIKI